MKDTKAAALKYAAAGYEVFPVGTDKRPLTRNGFRSATTDADQIARWWKRHPRANIGLRPPKGVVILDVDPRHGGNETLASLITEFGALPDGPMTFTGGGGQHIWLRARGGPFRSPGTGIDVKTHETGYVIVPPSVHRSGKPYRWRNPPSRHPIPDVPRRWVHHMRAQGDSRESRQLSVAPAALKHRVVHDGVPFTAVVAPNQAQWVKTIIDDDLPKLASRRRVGRNNGLNDVGLRLARCPVDREWLRHRLIESAVRTGVDGEDGRKQTLDSIGSAFSAADRDGLPDDWPEPIWPEDIHTEHQRPETNVKPVALSEAHNVFRKWLGEDFDTDGLDAMLAAVAVERFTNGSDLVWLLLISGSGNAKTETVQALDGIGAMVASSISSDAALLSASPKRERAKDATGGLLRKLGDHGVLGIKDVTSILSMDRTLRAKVLAALREVYDGKWTRDVGTDGGRTISWAGRITIIGGVTTAWDAAHSVVAAMGDRFVLVRMDSNLHRIQAGRNAIRNTGSETQMRSELADAVAGVIAGMNCEPTDLTEDETERLLVAADLVTRIRTGVEFDYRGDVIDAHLPEMPTRFAKQLSQIVRGAIAVGMSRESAMRLAIRCARDSVPPMRLSILKDIDMHPYSTSSDVRRRIDKPRATVDRQLQALYILGLVSLDETPYFERVQWHYTLAEGVDPDVLS